MIVRHGPSPILDRVAIALSGLCVVHCLATSVLLALMSAAGGMLSNPIIHEGGLALAIALGAVALGRGALVHRRLAPLVTGAVGIGFMATALAMPHGASETAWTIAGVALLATAHVLNRRGCASMPRR
ncbi:MerC domain-containing protein [Sphingomonas sp.]|uniref:MerC domain-containing protein n=1 Tax=Sphingomonas sp. TaxID=28214 RepID=UPI0035BBEEE5